MRISSTLNSIKKKLNKHSDRVVLQDILDVSSGGNYFILFLMSCLSNIPTPVIPIISVFFGILMVICSVQILLNFKTIKIPKFLQNIKINKDLLFYAIDKVVNLFKKIENKTKVRLIFIFYNKQQKLILHIIMLIMSILVIIPIPFVSFLPAVAVMLILFGLFNRDGLCILLGVILSLISLLIYLLFIVIIGKAVR